LALSVRGTLLLLAAALVALALAGGPAWAQDGGGNEPPPEPPPDSGSLIYVDAFGNTVDISSTGIAVTSSFLGNGSPPGDCEINCEPSPPPGDGGGGENPPPGPGPDPDPGPGSGGLIFVEVTASGIVVDFGSSPGLDFNWNNNIP
jgi:hypothetical protein